eukprot:71736_1
MSLHLFNCSYFITNSASFIHALDVCSPYAYDENITYSTKYVCNSNGNINYLYWDNEDCENSTLGIITNYKTKKDLVSINCDGTYDCSSILDVWADADDLSFNYVAVIFGACSNGYMYDCDDATLYSYWSDTGSCGANYMHNAVSNVMPSYSVIECNSLQPHTTIIPTLHPTIIPTLHTTIIPTLHPTIIPTLHPTIIPTL